MAQIPVGWYLGNVLSNNITLDDVLVTPITTIEEKPPHIIHWNGETLTFDSEKGEIGKFHFKDGFSYEGKMDYSALELFEYVKPYIIATIQPYLEIYTNQHKRPVISFSKQMTFGMKQALYRRRVETDLVSGWLEFLEQDKPVGCLWLSDSMTFGGNLEQSGMALYKFFYGYFDQYLSNILQAAGNEFIVP